MRFLIFYLLSFLSILPSFSQNKKTGEFSFSNFNKKKLSIKTPGKIDFAAMHADNIEVLDWRPDTVSIGFERKNYLTIPDIRTVFKNNLQSFIDFKQDSNSAGSKVIVCLHKLWLTQHLVQMNTYWKSGIMWKVDCFKKVSGTLTRLCQLDTVIENNYGSFSAAELVLLCLKESAQKINSALRQAGTSNQFVDLNRFKDKITNLPVLQDEQKKRGLYITYDQFLTNTPSNVEFEVEKNKLTDGVFVVNPSGTNELVRNIWGYCDGQKRYVKSGEKYFELCRVNNTFYIYGAKNINRVVSSDPGTASLFNLATNTNRRITTFYLSYLPFQLDITSGNIY